MWLWDILLSKIVTKIVSWNVNSIRVRLPHLSELIKSTNPDIVMLQETKSTNADFPYNDIKQFGYEVLTVGQKSYNGVAILSKIPIKIKNESLPTNNDDPQARFIEVTVQSNNPFDIASVYLPNGNPIDTEKFPYKLDWMKKLKDHIKTKLENYETFIFGGDYNIIPTSDDAVDINKWKNDALHHPKSIEIYREIINLGMTDVLRIFNPKPFEFTYWDYSRGAWEKDNGLRIDHFLASPKAVDRMFDCQIEKKFRGLERPSDHVPIWFEIN